MPDNSLEQARFDHVDGEGNLVFVASGRRFAVAMDDTLERAVLEAKQLASESRLRTRQPRGGESLPLSQIQALIRAGATPAQVADRYGLGEALVRRFAAPVETEKQYAVEQFLSVPAPKDSRARTVAELIERTLASALVDMAALRWQATRRGLEPWRITALFEASGHEVRAEWTWNMRDNAVTCLNSAAKKLLGEQNLGSSDDQRRAAPAFAFPPTSADAIRSVRIEREVSRWDPTHARTAGDDPHAQGASDSADGTATGESAAYSAESTSDDALRSDAPVPTGALALHPDPSSPLIAADAAAPSSLSQPATTAMPAAAASETSAESSPTAGSAASAPVAAADQPSPTAGAGDEPVKPAKRRSGRSAMPSWDEILFGE
ncbi:septation protein SepH [Bifidobacterium samirii]|nr:septation protein SepH [Bifidobacterium samirii]